ncbi:sigma-70 family RNA polymerase sigma factor [Chitinophaga pendula]|uniref:RNA polymerase sigma factor n=1 Tax=Chitinophaga TaxID=79328 RepID=UPI000BAFA198|nr:MULTISPECIES: sigma-70 family RNA polymerase sigma factor [Chitinophaga]ASZ11997.1 hypothetical protein CK934_14030 [Chitinophaga sp. MD30]UCJ04974.1 sigma-70 family RNA polymerase sigma factor [Chitinophaga pendula]
MLQQEDELLLERLRSGDDSAFTEIFKKYYKFLWLEASFLLKDVTIADDIVQDMFVRWWENKALSTVRISLKLYLLQSLRYRCINENIKHRNKQKKLQNYSITQSEGESFDHMVNSELGHQIANAINDIPEKSSRVFKMVYVEQLQQKDVAEELGISIQTLRNQIHTTLKTLRKKLAGSR